MEVSRNRQVNALYEHVACCTLYGIRCTFAVRGTTARNGNRASIPVTSIDLLVLVFAGVSGMGNGIDACPRVTNGNE